MKKEHQSIQQMQALFSSKDIAPIIHFLQEHHFQFDANEDLNTLVDATRHYFNLFSKKQTGYMSTEHLYPLPQHMLLRANMERSEDHWVHSIAAPEETIGRYSSLPHSGKISACFWDHNAEFDDDKFCSFLGFLKYIETHITNDCKSIEQVSLFKILMHPNQYPLSKIPLITKQLKDALFAFTVLMAVTIPFELILGFSIYASRATQRQWMNGREVIPADQIICATLMFFTLLIQFALSAAINNYGLQEVQKILNPSHAIKTQYKKDVQPSLKGLIANGMFADNPQPNVTSGKEESEMLQAR